MLSHPVHSQPQQTDQQREHVPSELTFWSLLAVSGFVLCCLFSVVGAGMVRGNAGGLGTDRTESESESQLVSEPLFLLEMGLTPIFEKK